MLSRALLARASPFGLSAVLATRACSRSLSTLHLGPPPRSALLCCAHLRRFSAAPAFRTENQDERRITPAPSGTCYVANIPYQVTAEQLKDAFSVFGKIVTVKLLTSDAGLSRGIGFVQFESVVEAVSFVETHAVDPIFVLDRQLYVEHAEKTRNAQGSVNPSDTLMVHKFQGDSEAEVRAMFGGHAGNILAVRFNKKEANQPSRGAFIQFHNVDIAAEAMDAFKNQNENTPITYAKQRQPPANSHSLTSRLSQHRRGP